MKGLILCAGKGTRLYPITLNFPKTLIPVANISILQACIEKLTELAIVEIGVVIHPSQEGLIREQVGHGEAWGAAITYIYQYEARGISDAVRQAQTFIGEEAFLLLLGDNLISQSLAELKLDVEERGSHGSLLLAEVANPRDYGIAEVLEGRIVQLEEKPKAPKSKLAVLGAYAFDSTIFEAVDHIKPSPRGEYEITDAIQWLIEHGKQVTYHVTEQLNMDVGTVGRWLDANRQMLAVLPPQNAIHKSVVAENCTIIAPVSINQGCVLKNCVIGPYVSIGADSQIEGCHIENSILLSGVHLKHIPYPLKDTVIGRQSAMTGLQAQKEGGNE
ncbi:glucose-1-phosphate thymidylyltransferase [Paenibacillus endophyticus]|uniref:Glucose-1-phosphate thymidylyltransferase n=1 Tax=Paenibacillus endophyticus TaxID=1294268 RepID=A0A7W5CC21_9BACL|nr:sugar phosphate nucleotidyltransferase [Paenibacillus endophyticus]MBB3154967.1 glucose-1-phosphate thymidylyltransferase [Paenibacillus endophyticus]